MCWRRKGVCAQLTWALTSRIRFRHEGLSVRGKAEVEAVGTGEAGPETFFKGEWVGFVVSEWGNPVRITAGRSAHKLDPVTRNGRPGIAIASASSSLPPVKSLRIVAPTSAISPR